MKNDLLPCPFCGGEAGIRFHPLYSNLKPYLPETADKKYYVQCLACATQRGAREYDTPDEAIGAWNTRPQPEPRALTLEELREMDGQPVWIKEIDEWAIVTVDKVGKYKNMPFVKGKIFNYDVARRKLTCFDRQPKGE